MKEMLPENDNRVSAMRLSVYGEKPGDVDTRYRPEEFSNRAWIPQTMGDQVWVLYEFKTEEARREWEETIPDGLIDRSLIEFARRFGWGSRDGMSGFLTSE